MPPLPLEPDDATRRELGQAVVAFASRFVEEHHDGPALGKPIDAALTARLLAPPPASGVALTDALDRLEEALGPGLDNSSGRFLGYIPNGGIYAAALGSFLGTATNQYTGGAHAAPGLVALEQSVLQWMASLFDLPEGAGGVLLSGGSLANLTALVTARSRFGDGFADGTVYTSERAHHSIAKAAHIAGIADDRVRTIATDDQLRLDVRALRAAVAHDLADGLRPMVVAATAGTTDTGAIDPLGACADVAAEHDAWFHVDAAYGGFFQLTERGRERLAGIDRADSMTIDAHKSLFLPYGIGGLLVRDTAPLVAAHEGHGAYMQDVGEHDLPHFLAMGPELTRPSRGLTVWLALQLHGVAPFRDELDRMLDLAEHATARLGAIDGIELIGPPPLSIVAFRASDDEATRRVQRALDDSGEVYVSSTTVHGRLYLRFALLSHRTTRDTVDAAIDVVGRAAGSAGSAA